MSLLLEALKKAEAAKRHAEEADGTPAAAEPVSPPVAPPAATLPRITPAHELELIDDEFAQAARFAGLDVPEPTRAPPPAGAAGAEAARVLFDAKRPPVGQRSPLAWLLGAAALVLLGIGGWVAWQIGSFDRDPPPTHARSPMPPPPPAPLPEAAADTLPPRVPAEAAAERSVATAAAAPVIAQPVAESSRFLTGQAAPVAPAAPPANIEPQGPPIRITRTAPVVPRDIAEGFAAFNAGEFDRARVAYESALRADPRNPDALHGLAALARTRGDDGLARQLLQRIAEVDPADTAVQVALNGYTDPAMQEARLLGIAAAQPHSAPAALALGNLYAAQARWREAQQAYFNAWTLAPGEPDHAYNLAVSLDQLRQTRLALQYYRQALALREHQPAAFDAQAVGTRIESLQTQMPMDAGAR